MGFKIFLHTDRINIYFSTKPHVSEVSHKFISTSVVNTADHEKKGKEKEIKNKNKNIYSIS